MADLHVLFLIVSPARGKKGQEKAKEKKRKAKQRKEEDAAIVHGLTSVKFGCEIWPSIRFFSISERPFSCHRCSCVDVRKDPLSRSLRRPPNDECKAQIDTGLR